MKNKILETYMKLRKNLLESDYLNLNCIILITPKAFCKLVSEDMTIEKNMEAECYYILLAGGKTPIKISNELGENVEFTIMQQKDYERMEYEKLLREFWKIFHN